MPRGGQTDAGGTYNTHAADIETTLRRMRSLRWTHGDFHFGQTLGNGRAATVYRAVHKSTGMRFAIKKCHAKGMSVEAERVRVEEEIAVHSTLFHPAVTTFYGSFTDHVGNVYMILEYCKRGDLFNLLYSPRIGHYGGNDEDDFVMSEAEVCERVLGPLISAVAYLHDRDIVHRDIKPENLMLSNESKGCKLADFGFAIDTSRDRAFTRWGPVENPHSCPPVSALEELCFFPERRFCRECTQARDVPLGAYHAPRAPLPLKNEASHATFAYSRFYINSTYPRRHNLAFS